MNGDDDPRWLLGQREKILFTTPLDYLSIYNPFFQLRPNGTMRYWEGKMTGKLPRSIPSRKDVKNNWYLYKCLMLFQKWSIQRSAVSIQMGGAKRWWYWWRCDGSSCTIYIPGMPWLRQKGKGGGQLHTLCLLEWSGKNQAQQTGNYNGARILLGIRLWQFLERTLSLEIAYHFAPITW